LEFQLIRISDGGDGQVPPPPPNCQAESSNSNNEEDQSHWNDPKKIQNQEKLLGKHDSYTLITSSPHINLVFQIPK
jgi:hypothetical protein